MQSGTKVWHLSYGAGVVEALVAGRRARVRFDGAPGLPRTVVLAELRLAGLGTEPVANLAKPAPESVPPPPPAPPPPARTRNKPRRPPAPRQPAVTARPDHADVAAPPATPADLADLRQTIEAMRLGVTPRRHAAQFTVGRDAEVEKLAPLLDSGSGFRSVWGGYGAGKSHFLEMAERLALEHGFAAARVVFDPLEMPPTHPKQLYAALLRELRIPDHEGSALEAVAEALHASPQHLERSGRAFSRFFSPWLHAWRVQDEHAIREMHDYLSGETVDRFAVEDALRSVGWRGPNLLSLSDYRTYGRLYTHLLGTLACWIRDAGHRGLVLLLDEVEFVDSLPNEDRYYAMEVLKHLAAATLPAAALGFDPSEPNELYRGGQEVLRHLALRFDDQQPLSVVFALTPLDELRKRYRRIVREDATNIDLSPIGREDLTALVDKVVGLYRRAYPGSAISASRAVELRRTALAKAPADASATRWIVQRVVAELDHIRYRWNSADGS